MVKMDLMSHICLLVVIYTAQVKCDGDTCSIRMWYLKLITDDVFNIDLTPEMLQLKQSIETTVLNTPDSSSAGDIEKNCQLLKMYNSMLKEKFNYDFESKHITKGQNSAPESKSEEIDVENKSKDNIKDNEIDNVTPEEKGGNEDRDDTHSKKEETNEQNEFKDDSHSESDNDIDQSSETSDEEITNDSNDIKEDSSEDETDIDETDLLDDETDVADSAVIDENNTQDDKNTLDDDKSVNQVDIIDDETDDSDDENDYADDTNENADDEFITRSIPFGVCWSFGCLQSDVFDVFEVFGRDDVKDTKPKETEDIEQTERDVIQNNEDNTEQQVQQNFPETKQTIKDNKREITFRNMCGRRDDTCNMQCFYMFSDRYCIVGYINNHETINVIKNVEQGKDGPNNNLFSKEESTNSDVDNETDPPQVSNTIEDSVIRTMEKEQDDTDIVEPKGMPDIGDSNNALDLDTEDKPLTKTPKESTVASTETATHPDTSHIDVDETKTKRASNSESTLVNEHGSKAVVKEVEREHANLFEEISDATNKLDQLEKSSKSSDTIKTMHDPKASTLSVDEFEKIVHETTSRYAQKVQALELMIMKLENNLLVEKLNKQNHSSTITRLENLIIKLENDFLKLNTQYDTIKTENENISKRQNHYLEIAYKNQKPTCKQLDFPDKSSKTAELLSQHQARITELTDILRNQSAIIKVIKDRYDTLEDQNRMLHQMIMNQTIFMTSIIHTMHDLTTQNNKNKEEIEALKAKVANKADISMASASKAIPKDNILANIDNYAVDDKINIGESNNDDTDDDLNNNQEDADINLKQYLEHKSTEEIITSWCPAINDSCPVCVYRSILKINCFPFRSLFWGSCGENCKTEAVIHEKTFDKEEADSTMLKSHETADSNSKSGEIKSDNFNEETSAKPSVDENSLNSKTIIKESETKNDEISKGEFNDDKDNTKIAENKLPEAEKKEKDLPNKGTNKKKLNTKQRKEKDKTGDNEVVKAEKPTLKKDKKTKETKKRIETEQKDSSLNSNKKSNDRQNSTEPQVDKTKHESTKADDNEKEKEELTKTGSKSDKKQREPPHDPDKAATQQTKNEEKQTMKDNAKKSDDISKTESKTATKERKVPVNLDKDKPNEPKDCYDYYKRGNKNDGVFKIHPVGHDGMIEVFCDMRNGGWTVIQRRQDGSMKFYREWKDYKKGFGGLYGEHWLGNDNIHLLTNQGYYQLRVDLMDWDKNKKFAEYEYFLVESEENGYRVNIDGYNGDAGDGLSKHNSHKFSTKDVDNDKVEKEFGGSCAVRFMGAGWYYKCYASNLNGKYYKGGKIPEKKYDGVTWKPWTGPNYSLKKAEMKIKPVNAK